MNLILTFIQINETSIKIMIIRRNTFFAKPESFGEYVHSITQIVFKYCPQKDKTQSQPFRCD